MRFLLDETGLKLGELSAREVRDVLETFLEVVERAGSSFAFPTRTLHVHAEPPARS